jgi:hypothetical protein
MGRLKDRRHEKERHDRSDAHSEPRGQPTRPVGTRREEDALALLSGNGFQQPLSSPFPRCRVGSRRVKRVAYDLQLVQHQLSLLSAY